MKFVLVLLLASNIMFAETLSELGFNIDLVCNTEEKLVVTVEELNYIYTGRVKHWLNGTPIKLVVVDTDSYCTKNFIQGLLGISINRFKEAVNKHEHIHLIPTRYGMMRFLEDNIGSIGILNKEEVYISTENGMIVIRIEE